MGNGIGVSCRRAAELIATIAIVIISIKNNDPIRSYHTEIQHFVSFPYLIAAIAILTHIIVSIVILTSRFSIIGIVGVHLAGFIIFIITYIISKFATKNYAMSSYFNYQYTFREVYSCITWGLVISTLTALQALLFVSPKCSY